MLREDRDKLRHCRGFTPVRTSPGSRQKRCLTYFDGVHQRLAVDNFQSTVLGKLFGVVG